MMARTLLASALCLVLLAAALGEAKRPKWHELSPAYTFERYVRDFRKVHKPGTKQWHERKALFDAALSHALAHNSDPTASYKLGVNHMSDWTKAEKQRINGGRLVDFEGVKTKPAAVHTYNGENLPKTLDWRLAVNPTVLTAIKNQGGCGDCWANAATETMESHYALRSGELHELSVQQVTSCMDDSVGCGGGGGCVGGFAELAFDYVQSNGNGIHQEWTYPFTSYTGEKGKCLNVTTMDIESGTYEGVVAGVSGYVAVDRNNALATMAALKNGPLAIYVDASGWPQYENGIFTQGAEGTCNYTNNITMDHVVQLVGWGTDAALGMDYWIVRNSWGAWWGEQGFIRVHRPATEACGWNVPNGLRCNGGTDQMWACGVCGLLMDPLYPLMTDGHQSI